jgi:anti-sigma factor RsiW
VKCEEARRLRDAYLDQALADDEALEFEAHVNECEGCWRELIELQDFGFDLDAPELQAMAMREPSPLPDDFTAQVMSRVETEKPAGLHMVWPWVRQKWSRRQVASFAYAMSATMVVISAGEVVFLWNQTTNQLGVWAVQAQAYWDATQATMGGASAYLMAAWQWIGNLFY